MKAACDKFVMCFVLLGVLGLIGCAPGLTIGEPSETDTSGGPVSYTITYTNASTVTLASEDVTLDKTGSADGAVAVTGTGTETRTVTISSISGDGTLGISIAEDTAGDAAPAAGPSDTFNVDNTPPGVEIGTPSATATTAGPVSYTVTYTDASDVTLADGDVTLNKTGSAQGNVTVSSKGIGTQTIMITDITGDGTLGVSIAAGTATDALGNAALSAGPSTTFTVDNTGPPVEISAPSVDNTEQGPVNYTVTYTDASSASLAVGDVTLNKTDTADGTVSVATKGVARTVTISDTIGDGTLGISLAAGTATDALGNLALAAGPSAIFNVYNLYFSRTYMLPGDVPLVLLTIPAGTSLRGSMTGDADETPVRPITISQPFLIGETEVTKAQWTAVMGTTPWNVLKGTVADDPDSPATDVSWNDAQDFITQLNDLTGETFGLPTEAQWEYACRAGTTTAYYFGDTAEELSLHGWWTVNTGDVSEPFAHAVGQLIANDFGLFDTSGNVWEWCEDWFAADYYAVSPDTDPLGPESGTLRLIRGGSWDNEAADLRSAERNALDPVIKRDGIGFRVVK